MCKKFPSNEFQNFHSNKEIAKFIFHKICFKDKAQIDLPKKIVYKYDSPSKFLWLSLYHEKFKYLWPVETNKKKREQKQQNVLFCTYS